MIYVKHDGVKELGLIKKDFIPTENKGQADLNRFSR